MKNPHSHIQSSGTYTTAHTHTSLQLHNNINHSYMSADIVVFEATPSGIMTVIAAARTLHSSSSNNNSSYENNHTSSNIDIVLISTKSHIGGMCTNGLSATDIGSFSQYVIGGITHEFFVQNGQHYNQNTSLPVYNLEPHIAEILFWSMIKLEQQHQESNDRGNVRLYVLLNMHLELVGVKKQQSGVGQIQSITLRNSTTNNNSLIQIDASLFVDASYEGDLYAKSGIVSYTTGRESSQQYNESLAGRQPVSKGVNQINLPISPYWEEDDERNRTQHKTLLPLVMESDHLHVGDHDGKMESCSFRLCFTKNHTNGIPILAPIKYNPQTFELARRYVRVLIQKGHNVTLKTFLGNIRSTHNNKLDCNNGGGISLDYIGGCQHWVNASLKERKQIFEEHKEYTLGLFYFLARDPSLPVQVRQSMQNYYLCKDEWRDNLHWPRELYIREGRRLIGDIVYTQHSFFQASCMNDSIALGGYGIDSHNVQRIPVVLNGITQVKNEGDIQVSHRKRRGNKQQKHDNIHEIPYQIMLPKQSECSNLVVPVAVSASHIGFASLRFEPTWMVLGHAAGTAAALCIQNNVTPHQLSVENLQQVLIDQGQIIHRPQAILKENRRVDASTL